MFALPSLCCLDSVGARPSSRQDRSDPLWPGPIPRGAGHVL